jgi:Spy/CpxP family protein refolding chaperone
VELQSLWTNSNADPKAIMDKEKELRDLQNQMKDKAVQMKLESRKILTPEQIAELGPGMGRGFGSGHMMGRGRGMGPGHGMCN